MTGIYHRAKSRLSCSHVIAASGTGSIGDQIYQPGPSEQDSSMEVVAKLDLWQPFDFQDDFVNRVDAALCRPVADDLFDPHIFGVGIPQGWVEPTRGMMVQKVGRTTGHTWGRIKDTHFRCTFPYPRPQHTGSADVWFRDQVLCTRYTDRGDSGALVLNEEGYAVGLHFAGSAASSIFNPISFVLDELGVELFTQSA